MPTKIAHGVMPMKLRILVSLASCGWLLYVTSIVFLVLECHVGLYFFLTIFSSHMGCIHCACIYMHTIPSM
jgi:hypothetical protein